MDSNNVNQKNSQKKITAQVIEKKNLCEGTTNYEITTLLLHVCMYAWVSPALILNSTEIIELKHSFLSLLRCHADNFAWK